MREADGIERWLAIADTLGLAGEIVVAHQAGRDLQPALARLSTSTAFGDSAMAVPDFKAGQLLLERCQSVLEKCAAPLPKVCSNVADQAVLCWHLHVVDGHSIAGAGWGVQARVEPRWTNPQKTVRERMWRSRHLKTGSVTMGALPGLVWIANAWEQEFGDLQPVGHGWLPPFEPFDSPVDYPLEGDRSEFVTDVTPPDGSLVQPGAEITKVWRLRNAGLVPWRGRRLTRLGVAEAPNLPRSPEWVRIADTEPGCQVDVAVPIRAPQLPGTYQLYFKMTDEQGRWYFPDRYTLGIYTTIVVPGVH